MGTRLWRLAILVGAAMALMVSSAPAPAFASAPRAASGGGATDPVVMRHIADIKSHAPAGVLSWTVAIKPMTVTKLAGGKGAAVHTNTVWGSCGSAWMAIGNLGGGRAWVALGWDIYYSAYWEGWNTGVFGRVANYNGGSGPVAPWSSTSWDTGYNAFLGAWTWAWGYANMAAYLYNGGVCTSNGPTASAYIT
jgi:hypothetical protein